MRLERLRPRRLGLRARITLSFALGAAVLSAVLAITTYLVTRGTLVRQREQVLLRQAYVNARSLVEPLQSENPNLVVLLTSLNQTGSEPAVVFKGQPFLLNPDVFGLIPTSVVARAESGLANRIRADVEGEAAFVVGIPLPGLDAQYYEYTSLDELSSTLRSLRVVLSGAALLTTAFGIVTGMWASGRAVRPLADAARAAEAIAGGRLDTRLVPVDDPDLLLLTQAFNDMASALEARVERDARFASDVSHELRSPLMTLAASAEVLQSRRDELPERAATAVDLLAGDVARFQGLVEDLLEISRFDAGAVHLNLEEVLLAEFVSMAIRASGAAGEGVPLEVQPEVDEAVIRADKRRLARVLANLLDNARYYGGGATSVNVEVSENAASMVVIAVQDGGPGVPPEERGLVFERFARGTSAGRRSSSDGSGLGLALVTEHVRLHGGKVWVEDRRDGSPGARFVIELPVVPL